MNSKQFQHQVVPLSERLFPMVSRLLGNKTDAEDAIQEIMLRLWNKRKQLAKHPNLPGFVFLTARNYCLDVLKKVKPDFDDLPDQINALVWATEDSNTLEEQELAKLIKQLVSRLPQQQQTVLVLHDLDGLEYHEIAEISGLKIEHIRVILSRARKFVGTELKKSYCYE